MPVLFKDLDLPAEAKKSLAELGNYSITRNTWSSYSTVNRLFLKCQKDNNRVCNWPVSNTDILFFIHWLAETRKLKGNTINTYLSGLRQLHILKGIEPPTIRTATVKLVLTGKKNKDAAETRATDKKRRLPVTVSVMTLLKKLIRNWARPVEDRLLVWTVCTVAFAGSFRIHELLCKTEHSFDPDYTLLTDDLKRTSNNIQISLKCPKESKSAAPTVVDIYASGGQLCPVTAFDRWATRAKPQTRHPVFSFSNGKPLTGRKLNSFLKELLGPYLDYRQGSITTHSFRAGIPSEMAAAGFEDDDIKKQGRWSSRAFNAYTKLPRTQRAMTAKAIQKQLNL
jgi:hypothetical protein